MSAANTVSRVPLAGLLIATAAVYAAVVKLGFVWDDVPLIARNGLLGGDLGTVLAADLWGGAPIGGQLSGYFRPLLMASLWLDRLLWGEWAPGYHVQGLIWHLAAVVLLYRLVGRLLGGPAALVAATLFALHPVQTEAVAWVAARNDPMAAALSFAALDQLVGREWRPWRAGVAVLLTALAGFAKESVVLLPVLVLVLDTAAMGRWRWRPVLPVALGIGVVLVVRVSVGVGGVALPAAQNIGLLLHRWDAVLGVIGASLVDPLHLSVGRSLEYLDREPGWRLGLGWLAMGGVLTLLLPRSSRRWVAAGLVWAAALYLPTLVPIADSGLVGERYAYAPLAGLGLALGAVLGGRDAPRARPMAGAVAIGVLGAVFIPQRLSDWQTDIRLWESAVRVTPNAFTHVSLGHAYRDGDQPLKALDQFRAALADPVPDLSACPRLVGTALALANPELAAQLGDAALNRGCDPGGPHTDSGVFAGQYAVALAFAGRWADARRVVDGARPDREGRLDVVRGALLRLDGDDAAFDAMVASWSGSEPLAEQVDRFLERAPAPAD